MLTYQHDEKVSILATPAAPLNMSSNHPPIQKLLDWHGRYGNRAVQRMLNGSQSRVSPLPAKLKTGIEALSNLPMDDVTVHYNSDKPAEVRALAFAQGTEIHLAPGQEKHLPHEAWHVAQQKKGRVKPTIQTKGVSINDDADLEREADKMGAKALHMIRGEHLAMSSTLRKPNSLQRNMHNRFRSSEEGDQIQMKSSIAVVQLQPMDVTDPNYDKVYRNCRLLLSELIEIGLHGFPNDDRGKLFLGTNDMEKAAPIFKDIWDGSHSFDDLASYFTRVLDQRAEVIPVGEMDRYRKRIANIRNIVVQVPRGISRSPAPVRATSSSVSIASAMRLSPSPSVPAASASGGGDVQRMLRFLSVAVRAGSETGLGNCAYLIGDFLPAGHKSRGEVTQAYYQDEFDESLWMARIEKAADMIAMAAQNSGATQVQLIGNANVAQRKFPTHIELNALKSFKSAKVVKAMQIGPGTTREDIIRFILSYNK